MDYADQPFEDEYTLEQLLELVAVTPIEDDTRWEAFNDEIDGWARHALAANGFGDY
jgi:hypothetical protein